MKTLILLLLICALGASPYPVARGQGEDPRQPVEISVSSAGTSANGRSAWPSLTFDGGLVVFTSWADNLVEQDGNHAADIFLRDPTSSRTRQLSVSSQAQPADAASFQASISASGRWVVFSSLAGNITGPYEQPDTNGLADVYLRDRDFATTQRISLTPSGGQVAGWSDQPAISASGRYIAYASTARSLDEADTDDQADIFLYDHQEVVTRLVSSPDGGEKSGEAYLPAISADSRYIAYFYRDGSGVSLHLYDQVSRQTVSVPAAAGSGGLQPPGWQVSPLALSPDGGHLAWVAFNASQASLYQFNRLEHLTTRLLSVALASKSTAAPSVSYTADGLQMLLSLSGLVYRIDPLTGASQTLAELEGSSPTSSASGAVVSLDGRVLAYSIPAAQGQALYTLEQDPVYQSHAVVSGWMSDGLGNPLEGMPISAGEGLQTTSAADGSYVFRDLPDGEYVILPLQEGFAFSPPRWRITLGAGQPPAIGLSFAASPQGAVDAARLDIGMPYSLSRGCESPFTPCGGPYHGFFSGDCTDLVLDGYLNGLKINIQTALERDYYANPRRYYRWRDARSAHDMYRFFAYTGMLLPPPSDYMPGDIVFFDWENDGLVDHVALISEVDGANRPLRMLDATGFIAENPSGKAAELEWRPYHQQSSPGHARWLRASHSPVDRASQSADLLLVALDSPLVELSLRDSLDRVVSPAAQEIPGSQWMSTGLGQVLSISNPLQQNGVYSIELKTSQAASYQLGLQAIQATQLTASSVYTGTLQAGGTLTLPIQLQIEQNKLTLSAP